MELLNRNPFRVFKANDLDNSEINAHWVDMPGQGFLELFSPKSKEATYIVGGKGSGKTHLMRYFSFHSQSLRYGNQIAAGIKNDGYIGIYARASALHANKFEQLDIPQINRDKVFEYYFELWFSINLLNIVVEIKNNEQELFQSREAEAVRKILNLFDKLPESMDEVITFENLGSFFQSESKKIDFEVMNFPFTESFNVLLLASRGSLIFGIPKVLSETFELFYNITFNYLVDELENFNEQQQIYISTLIREKCVPSNFKVGARPYGIKTTVTLADGEKNKKGHEVDIIRLDEIIRSRQKQYEKFAIELIIQRLTSENFLSPQHFSVAQDQEKSKREYVESLFETPEFNLISVQGNGHSKYITEIGKKLEKSIRAKANLGDSFKSYIETIKSNLSYPNNILIERAGVSLFCSLWSQRDATFEDLLNFSEEVRREYQAHQNGDSSDKISTKLGHHKNDFLAAHLRQTSQNNLEQYTGLDNLLVMTLANPRALISWLQFAYKYEVFSGNSPFISVKKIGIASQKMAIRESFNDFFNDANTEGELGAEVTSAISRIAELMRQDRYANKPVESSVSSFSVDTAQISDSSKDVLNWALLTGVIVSLDDRQDKNSQKVISKFYINPLLCPKWGISITQRGCLDFRAADFDVIFSRSREADFNLMIQEFSKKRNIPFSFAKNRFDAAEGQLGMDI